MYHWAPTAFIQKSSNVNSNVKLVKYEQQCVSGAKTHLSANRKQSNKCDLWKGLQEGPCELKMKKSDFPTRQADKTSAVMNGVNSHADRYRIIEP